MSRTPHLIFNLPQDVIFDILSRLPTKSLIQFTSVCTSSPPLISHPSFTKLHLSSPTAADDHRLLIYYESTDYINQFYSFRSPITCQESLKLQIPYKNLHGYLRIVGSNKGVICFFDTNYYSNVGTVILWNPSINKFKKIEDACYILDRFSHFVVGFGFVSRTCEFKIVVIVYYLDNFNTNSVLVYSLGTTNSWKKKEDSIAPCFLTRGWSSNVFVNGFVNWLACTEVMMGVSHEIMAFDLDDELFHVLNLPKNVRPSYNQVCLASYGDNSSLTLGAHYLELNGEKWEMWVMGDYGVADSWKKVCVISQPMLSIPPLLMKNDNEVLMVTNDGRLMMFDVIKNEMFDLKTSGLPPMFRAISYTSSLALLHD